MQTRYCVGSGDRVVVTARKGSAVDDYVVATGVGLLGYYLRSLRDRPASSGEGWTWVL